MSILTPKKGMFITLGLACSLLLGACDSNSPPTESAAKTAPASSSEQTAKADESLKELAHEAYIFTYPLVMNYRTMYMQAIQSGGFGDWVHLGTATPTDKDIVTPNNDTPYSYAWLDLRAEPWILEVPQIEENRFYTSQWDDLYGYVLDNVGSVEDGNDGTRVMFVAPSWEGEKPGGVDRIIRGESSFIGSLTRTQLMGDMSDLARVKEIQSQYELTPLHEYTDGQAPPPAKNIDWPAWSEGDETTMKYWQYAALMLQLVERKDVDAAQYEALQKLGITEGDLDLSALSDTQRQALEAGIESARQKMTDISNGQIDAAKFFGSRDRIGTDYLNRAMGVFMGIFGNVKEQSMYFSVAKDSKGRLFDGSQYDYTLTFSAEQVPPVEYFWSMTMYGLPDRYLVANDIERYNIGSATAGLKTADDGSITLYISSTKPEGDKVSNWLPAKEGPFWMVLRTYGPKQSILQGEWLPPEPVATPKE